MQLLTGEACSPTRSQRQVKPDLSNMAGVGRIRPQIGRHRTMTSPQAVRNQPRIGRTSRNNRPKLADIVRHWSQPPPTRPNSRWSKCVPIGRDRRNWKRSFQKSPTSSQIGRHRPIWPSSGHMLAKKPNFPHHKHKDAITPNGHARGPLRLNADAWREFARKRRLRRTLNFNQILSKSGQIWPTQVDRGPFLDEFGNRRAQFVRARPTLVEFGSDFDGIRNIWPKSEHNCSTSTNLV